MNLDKNAEIFAEARHQIEHEDFIAAVTEAKTRIRAADAKQAAKKWWHKLVPFVITITRRT